MPSKVYVGIAHLAFDNVLNPNVDVLLEQFNAKSLVLTFSNAVIAPQDYSYIGVLFPLTQLIFKGTITGKEQGTTWTRLIIKAEPRDSPGYCYIRFI